MKFITTFVIALSMISATYAQTSNGTGGNNDSVTFVQSTLNGVDEQINIPGQPVEDATRRDAIADFYVNVQTWVEQQRSAKGPNATVGVVVVKAPFEDLVTTPLRTEVRSLVSVTIHSDTGDYAFPLQEHPLLTTYPTLANQILFGQNLNTFENKYNWTAKCICPEPLHLNVSNEVKAAVMDHFNFLANHDWRQYEDELRTLFWLQDVQNTEAENDIYFSEFDDILDPLSPSTKFVDPVTGNERQFTYEDLSASVYQDGEFQYCIFVGEYQVNTKTYVKPTGNNPGGNTGN